MLENMWPVKDPSMFFVQNSSNWSDAWQVLSKSLHLAVEVHLGDKILAPDSLFWASFEIGNLWGKSNPLAETKHVGCLASAHAVDSPEVSAKSRCPAIWTNQIVYLFYCSWFSYNYVLLIAFLYMFFVIYLHTYIFQGPTRRPCPNDLALTSSFARSCARSEFTADSSQSWASLTGRGIS